MDCCRYLFSSERRRGGEGGQGGRKKKNKEKGVGEGGERTGGEGTRRRGLTNKVNGGGGGVTGCINAKFARSKKKPDKRDPSVFFLVFL